MKKSNKKVIIIVCSILLIVIIGLYFLLQNNTEVKTVSCNFSTDNYSLVSYNVELEANYTNPSSIDVMIGTIEFVINNKELLEKIDYIEESIKEYYKKLEKSDAINVDVLRAEDNLVIKYEIDYKNYDSSMLKNENLIMSINTEDEEIPSVKSLKETVSKAGGVCIEK